MNVNLTILDQNGLPVLCACGKPASCYSVVLGRSVVHCPECDPAGPPCPLCEGSGHLPR